MTDAFVLGGVRTPVGRYGERLPKSKVCAEAFFGAVSRSAAVSMASGMVPMCGRR